MRMVAATLMFCCAANVPASTRGIVIEGSQKVVRK